MEPSTPPSRRIITSSLLSKTAQSPLHIEDNDINIGRVAEEQRSTDSTHSSRAHFYPALEQPWSHRPSSLVDNTYGFPGYDRDPRGQGTFPSYVNHSPHKSVVELRQGPTLSRSNSLQVDLPSLASQASRQESPRALVRTKIKRAPASWSSNGIETSSGPPPALITQRTLTTSHGIWPINNPTLDTETFVNFGGAFPPAKHSDPMRNITQRRSPSPTKSARPSSWGNATIKITNHRRSKEDLPEQKDRDRTLRALEGRDVESPTHGKEDVFLNLARTNLSQEGGEGPSLRTERRRSRVGLNGKRQSLPLESPSSNLLRMPLQGPNGDATGGVDSSPASAVEEPRYQTQSRRTSHPANHSLAKSSFHTKAPPPPAASAHPLDDMSRLRYFESAARGSSAARSTVGIDHTSRNGSSIRGAGRSQALLLQGNQMYNSNPNSYESSPLVNRAVAASKADGASSTTSTNASSTVWDELDNLKSRIRKLESNGKMNSTSGGGGGGGGLPERPRTATTTMTTISSSPKHRTLSSVNPTIEEMAGAGIHPLLYAALAKSRPLLGSEIYRALEGTAMDALTLAAAMTNGLEYPPRNNDHLVSGASVIMTNGVVSERQVRRKADGICRGLTELCIALADAASSSETSPPNTGSSTNMDSSLLQYHHRHRRQPSSGGGGGGAKELRFQEPSESRQGSLEPGESHPPSSSSMVGAGTRTTSRALTRAEARRTSLLALNANNNKGSRNNNNNGRDALRPAEAVKQPSSRIASTTSSPQITLPKQRSRTNMLLLLNDNNNSHHNNEDANAESRRSQRPISIQVRAPSRADGTEAGIHTLGSGGKQHLRRSSIGLRGLIHHNLDSTTAATYQQQSGGNVSSTGGARRYHLERPSRTLPAILQQQGVEDQDRDTEENTITNANFHLSSRRRERARSLGSGTGSGGGSAGFVSTRDAGFIDRAGKGEVRFVDR
ncbi:MAG: hypothetical protein M1816_000194 [Peltula sp. TS41687]|nr:MAG: hypothetical protein M1816_000194 [Peltula sp. TS41687]